MRRSDGYFCESMIDTLTIARDLKDAGVAWKQAQAHAKAIAGAAEKQHQDVATKDFVTSQIKTVRAEISNVRAEISNVRTEISDLRGEMSTMASDLRGEMKAQESRLLRWAIATALTVGGILFAALNSSLG